MCRRVSPCSKDRPSCQQVISWPWHEIIRPSRTRSYRARTPSPRIGPSKHGIGSQASLPSAVHSQLEEEVEFSNLPLQRHSLPSITSRKPDSRAIRYALLVWLVVKASAAMFLSEYRLGPHQLRRPTTCNHPFRETISDAALFALAW